MGEKATRCNTLEVRWIARHYHLIWCPQRDQLDVAIIIEHCVPLTDLVKALHQPIIISLILPPPHRDAGTDCSLSQNRDLHDTAFGTTGLYHFHLYLPDAADASPGLQSDLQLQPRRPS